MPGVALTAGPDARWLTSNGQRTIRGVVAAAQPDGRYELELHLMVAWPPGPLELLADDLRRRILVAAKRAGLEPELGEIQVQIDAVQAPDDPSPFGELL